MRLNNATDHPLDGRPPGMTESLPDLDNSRVLLIGGAGQPHLCHVLEMVLGRLGAQVCHVPDRSRVLHHIREIDTAYDLAVGVCEPFAHVRMEQTLERVLGYYGGLVGIVLISFDALYPRIAESSGLTAVYWGGPDKLQRLSMAINDELHLLERRLRYR